MSDILRLIIGCVFLAFLVGIGMFFISVLMSVVSMIVGGVVMFFGWLWGLVFGK